MDIKTEGRKKSVTEFEFVSAIPVRRWFNNANIEVNITDAGFAHRMAYIYASYCDTKTRMTTEDGVRALRKYWYITPAEKDKLMSVVMRNKKAPKKAKKREPKKQVEKHILTVEDICHNLFELGANRAGGVL